MSLQFVFGNSGSGKSDYLYQSILEEAEREPEKNFLLLVPEQFTMQTQRELVWRQPNHAIMNVDVLSFCASGVPCVRRSRNAGSGHF